MNTLSVVNRYSWYSFCAVSVQGNSLSVDPYLSDCMNKMHAPHIYLFIYLFTYYLLIYSFIR
jgi:hypothetical protein